MVLQLRTPVAGSSSSAANRRRAWGPGALALGGRRGKTPDFVRNTHIQDAKTVQTCQIQLWVYQKVVLNCKIYKINVEIPKGFMYNNLVAVFSPYCKNSGGRQVLPKGE